MIRIYVPVRYSAWLSGDFGRRLERDLGRSIKDLPDVRVLRIMGGFIIDTSEIEGVAVERVVRAMEALEDGVAQQYPAFHEELGPLWANTVQAIL